MCKVPMSATLQNGHGDNPTVTLQIAPGGTPKGTVDDDRTSTLEYIGRRGLSLSGSYQQGYSTAYNTRSHITVVCNGYIPAHISN